MENELNTVMNHSVQQRTCPMCRTSWEDPSMIVDMTTIQSEEEAGRERLAEGQPSTSSS